jgi:chromosome segregation ATPase
MDKKISSAINQELKTKQMCYEKEEKRLKEKKEFEDKISNAMEDLQFLNKSKNLVTKNIKNADQRIAELKNSLEVLQTQKYLLTKAKNDTIMDMKEYEAKLSNVNPDFKKFMEDLNKSNFQLKFIFFRHS